LTAKEKFQRVVEDLVSEGVYPSPKAILSILVGETKRHSLNGRQIRWRTEVLERRGWTRHPEARKDVWEAGGGKYPRFSWIRP
jgi:hypothetical protein